MPKSLLQSETWYFEIMFKGFVMNIQRFNALIQQ